MFKKIKGRLNDFLWKTYHKVRKKSYRPYKNPENIEALKLIPPCSLGHVFGSNVVTKECEKLMLDIGDDEAPTHSIIYLGCGNHTIAEADVFYSKNKLERYAQSRIVFHYFRDLNIEEVEELKRRVYYLLQKKMVYDVKGYIGFLPRIIPYFERFKILSGSDTTVFCSDGNVVVYHGDKENNDLEIQTWTLMRNISVIYEANGNCPADIYAFMEQLHEMFPEKVGRIELMPEE